MLSTHPDLTPNPHCPRKALQTIPLLHLLAHLLHWHDEQRGHRVADEQHQEEGTEHGDLPGGIRMERQVVQDIRIVRLEDVTQEQEGIQEAQSTEHPRVEAFNCDIHVMALP